MNVRADRHVPRSALAILMACAVALGASSTAAQVAEPIGLEVAPDVRRVDAERLRAAVAAELGVSVSSAAKPAGGVLRVSRSGDTGIVVTYRRDERTVTREIQVPERDDMAVQAVALLAGNLVRDEAAEVIASLRPRPEPDAIGEGAAASAPSDAERAAEPDRPQPPAPTTAAAKKPTDEARHRRGARTGESTAPRAGCFHPRDAATPAGRDGSDRLTLVPIGGDFVPGVGSSSMYGGSDVRNVSINFVGLAAGVYGGEAAAIVNLDTQLVCGAQAAGIANAVGGHVTGAQVAGVANLARGHVEGAQVSGVFNAAGSVSGAQIGLVNVAGEVRGAQVGLFNYAEDSDASIGLVSIVRRGRTQLQLWATEWGFAGAAIKHGGRRVHGIYGAGGRAPVGDEPARPVVALGIGLRLEPSDGWWIDLDAVGHGLVPTGDVEGTLVVGSVGPLVGVRLVDSVSLYVAPTYNVGLAAKPTRADLSVVGGHDLRDGEGWSLRGWPGLAAGVQMF